MPIAISMKARALSLTGLSGDVVVRGSAWCLPGPMFPSPYVPRFIILVLVSHAPQSLCYPEMFPSPVAPQTYITQSLCSPVPMFPIFPIPMFPSPYVPQSLCSPVHLFPSPYRCSPVPMFPRPIPQKCFPFPIFPKHVPQSLCSPVPMFPKHVLHCLCSPVPMFLQLVHQPLCPPVLLQRSVFHSLHSPHMIPSLYVVIIASQKTRTG